MRRDLNDRRQLTWPVRMTSSQDSLAVLAWGRSKMLPEVTEAKAEADMWT